MYPVSDPSSLRFFFFFILRSSSTGMLLHKAAACAAPPVAKQVAFRSASQRRPGARRVFLSAEGQIWSLLACRRVAVLTSE